MKHPLVHFVAAALLMCGILFIGPARLSALDAVQPKASESVAADFERARKQLRSFILENRRYDLAEAETWARSLREDGSWSDVDYVSKARSSWPAAQHVQRISAMTLALRDPAASEAQKQTLDKAIHGALGHWRHHDYKCPNWFHNRIGTPSKFCEIALVLDQQNRPEELEYLENTVMPRCKVGESTGQNRVWLAGINLMFGLIKGNEEEVTKAASTMFSEAVIATPNEGIQTDFSFHQHGAQLQFGNYGLSFADDQTQWWSVLRGTRWTMPQSGQMVMRDYLLSGQNWVVWRGYNDVSCCGRAFAPGVQASRGAKVVSVMNRVSSLDPARSEDYLACVKRNQVDGTNELVGCRYFWRSDYLVHRRKDFAVTLKMCSTRVKGSESLNGQNLSGYHLADGATYVYRTGEEYKDIFPLWNWRMLPGVTCAQHDGPMPGFGSYRLESDFVGAVTDGENGCAVLDYSRDGVFAKKAWFCCGDQVVCLGSGIRSTADVKAPIMTTINQCLLRGKVRFSNGKMEGDLQAGAHSFTDLKWIEHDGIRYTLPMGQKVVVTNQHRTGNWDIVAKTPAMPTQDVSGYVFDLGILHGSQPTDGSYAYCISPSSVSDSFEILSNTQKLQSVRFVRNLVGAVFHVPGRLEYAPERFVEVDSACVLLIDFSQKATSVRAADPTQKLRSLGLEIDGRKHVVKLPVEGEAGKSVVVQ